MSAVDAWSAGAFDEVAFDAATFQTTISSTAGITLGGIDARNRMRKYGGPVIRDILNDAPNTCSFVVDGEAPAVGQTLRITIADGVVVLFAGRVQTVESSFEGQPAHLVWRATAIDDTWQANWLRPFGTWTDTSATTIAQAITTTYAPGLTAAGVAADLPAVTITFDGASAFINCLAQLATLIGGYAKVEDGIVYLFLEDTTTTPDPIDISHPFLLDPPITITTDGSQIRTRVYGKGYGEAIRADVSVSETLLPIEDGAMFPPLGARLIAGRTPDGAQSDHLTYTGFQPRGLGTLVGPGAAPGSAPALALQAGAGVTSGAHDITVVHVTAAGKSLAGPVGSITVGTVAGPTTAPVANTPLAGTGPDAGAHDYVVTFSALGGETVSGPVSNSITTSASIGLIPAPDDACSVSYIPLVPGNIGSTVTNNYRATFVNATGETEGGVITAAAAPGPPVAGGVGFSAGMPTTGGSMATGNYTYWCSALTASGYETILANPIAVTVSGSNNAVQIGLSTHLDPRVTKRRVYRTKVGGADPAGGNGGYLVQEVDNTASGYVFTDTKADSALGEVYYLPSYGSPSGPRGTDPGYQNYLTAIPVGPAGTTQRKIYRQHNSVGSYKLVTTLSNNTETTYTDNKAEGALGVVCPSSNTTGSAAQKILVSAIPIGPLGTTARNLYRRFNGVTSFYLVTTIANNTATTYTDTTPNASLGAAAPGAATAVGNQIALTAIPVGAAAVTQREIYMSPAGGGTRRRVLTIADNTTTTGTITMSDATLAGQIAEPSSDTSGLQQPTGQVNVGATTIPLASAATFLTTGGWVELGGGQVVRYTGISGQALTGVPAAGAGSIYSTVTYGSTAIPAPMLTGVAAVTGPPSARALAGSILKGSRVHLWVQRDDLQAQAEQVARTGGWGVVEYLITDARRGLTSLQARCDADLAMFARPIITVTYATRDIKTKSGKTVSVDLAAPSVYEALTIQEVTISEIDWVPGLMPRFSVTASSVRFSLEDTLRQLIVKE